MSGCPRTADGDIDGVSASDSRVEISENLGGYSVEFPLSMSVVQGEANLSRYEVSVGPVDVGAEFVSATGGCCTNYFDESLLVWTCGGDCTCGGTGGHSYVVNPCGVGVGKDAYFRIQVLPNDYPDEKIVWPNETAGAVDFVGGNTGWVATTASGGRVWHLMRFKNVFGVHRMG